jgi:hypothetical protein
MLEIIKTNNGYMVQQNGEDYLCDANGDNLWDTYAEAEAVFWGVSQTYPTQSIRDAVGRVITGEQMNYYNGEIETYFGESEVSTTIKFKTEGDPDQYLYDVASNFWGHAHDEEGGLHDFGDKSACGGRWQRVDAGIYNALTIIVELHHLGENQ